MRSRNPAGIAAWLRVARPDRRRTAFCILAAAAGVAGNGSIGAVFVAPAICAPVCLSGWFHLRDEARI